MSSRPSPLQMPRKNPFATRVRRAGNESTRELSVHSGVHGKMISSTPATALIKTNRKTEMRCIHSWTSRGRFSAGSRRIGGVSAEGPEGWGALPGAPENRGSLIQGSSGSAGQIRVRWVPVNKTSKAIRPILRLQALNALGHIAVIDVASVNVHE